jgi:hypothetical protein
LGASFLDGTRSLLLVAFAQVARRPTSSSPEVTFAEGGIAGRLDVGSRLTASLEASLGVAGVHHDRALGSSDQPTHLELDAEIRVRWWRAAWIGLDASASRDVDRIVYAAGRTYRTRSMPDLRLGFALGVWVWG